MKIQIKQNGFNNENDLQRVNLLIHSLKGIKNAYLYCTESEPDSDADLIIDYDGLEFSIRHNPNNTPNLSGHGSEVSGISFEKLNPHYFVEVVNGTTEVTKLPIGEGSVSRATQNEIAKKAGMALATAAAAKSANTFCIGCDTPTMCALHGCDANVRLKLQDCPPCTCSSRGEKACLRHNTFGMSALKMGASIIE